VKNLTGGNNTKSDFIINGNTKLQPIQNLFDTGKDIERTKEDDEDMEASSEDDLNDTILEAEN